MKLWRMVPLCRVAFLLARIKLKVSLLLLNNDIFKLNRIRIARNYVLQTICESSEFIFIILHTYVEHIYMKNYRYGHTINATHQSQCPQHDNYKKHSGIILLDICPLSLGFIVEGGMMHKMIPRNSVIPTKKSSVFTTSYDYQTVIEIEVLGGL